jgi:hypothetical protein
MRHLSPVSRDRSGECGYDRRVGRNAQHLAERLVRRNLAKSPWLVASVVLALIATVGCDSSSGESPPPVATEIENVGQFDPVTYYDLWHGDLSLPQIPHDSITRAEWERLVSAHRADGILSMNADEQRTLMQGALKAYLLAVRSTRREIRVEGDDARHSSVIEEYAKADGFRVALEANDVESAGLTYVGPDLVLIESGLEHEIVLANGWQDANPIEVWTSHDDATWDCELGSNDGLPFLVLTYFGQLTGLLDGTPKNSVRAGNRDVILFEVGTRYGPSFTWVDAASLFPIAYRFPEAAEEAFPGDPIPARVVSILGFNIAERVERPGPDCLDSG